MRSQSMGKTRFRASFGSCLLLLALVFGPSAWTRSLHHTDEAPSSNIFSFHFGHADCHHDDVNHGTCCLDVPRFSASAPSQSSSSKRQDEKKPRQKVGSALLKFSPVLDWHRLANTRHIWHLATRLSPGTHHSIAVTILLI